MLAQAVTSINTRINRTRLLPSSRAANEARQMAERYPTDEHTFEDFEDYMRRARNPAGTNVGATECACGAKKGKSKWARVANGQP